MTPPLFSTGALEAGQKGRVISFLCLLSASFAWMVTASLGDRFTRTATGVLAVAAMVTLQWTLRRYYGAGERLPDGRSDGPGLVREWVMPALLLSGVVVSLAIVRVPIMAFAVGVSLMVLSAKHRALLVAGAGGQIVATVVAVILLRPAHPDRDEWLACSTAVVLWATTVVLLRTGVEPLRVARGSA